MPRVGTLSNTPDGSPAPAPASPAKGETPLPVATRVGPSLEEIMVRHRKNPKHADLIVPYEVAPSYPTGKKPRLCFSETCRAPLAEDYKKWHCPKCEERMGGTTSGRR